jgi:FkbM family methyltransferase
MSHKRGLSRYLNFVRAVVRYKTVSRRRISELAETEYDQLVRKYLSNPPESVLTKQGFWIYLNPEDGKISASIALTGSYSILQESQITKLFESLVKKTSIVVDVGANIGWYSLLAAKSAKRVHAVEPDPRSYSLLLKSIAANKFDNIVAHPCCVSDHDGVETLYISNTRNKGLHSIVWKAGLQSVLVRSVTLDALFPTENIDLLKLDVEGAESKALAGARKLVRDRRIKQIIMEWNPSFWHDRRILTCFDAYTIDRKRRFEFVDSHDQSVFLVPKEDGVTLS